MITNNSMASRKKERHGMANSPTYNSWLSMRTRCNNPNSNNYHLYGARGVLVCSRWQVSFAHFVDDMGVRPPGMTLDRIDCSGHYERGNCRWASLKQQANNRRTNRLICFEGATRTIEEWAEFYDINTQTLRARIRKEIPLVECFSTVRRDRYGRGIGRVLRYGQARV